MDRSERGKRISLFVYGTLRKGEPNHDRFCRGVLSVVPATVRGRIHRLGNGLLVLQVPPEDILTFGTVHPTFDAEIQHDFSLLLPGMPRPKPRGDREDVPGELLTFDDPEVRLPRIDRLEGYRPNGESLYRRVLLRVSAKADQRETTAWCYVEGTHTLGLSIW